MEKKKVEVFIGCKIGTENYPYFEGEVAGDQIVEHLLSDCAYAWKPNDEAEGGHFVPGDLCIWYLGLNEKFGELYIKDGDLEWRWKWGFGESNFEYVTKFVKRLLTQEVITKEQCRKLMDAIEIGKTIGDMYEIPDYLETVSAGKRWIPKITHTKQHMKDLIKTVCGYFEQKGMKVKPTMEGRKESGPTDIS
jgi:hypothetical protein